jgi:serine/threonine protein kinase
MLQQARKQAFQLAHDLNISNKPPLLKTLYCVGFVQDRENQRFGFLFQLPTNADVTFSPVTLHAYLKGDKFNGKSIPLPTFGERIRLARSLAFSMIELHNAGILHKSLHSGNVLFFPARVTNTISVSESYIGGFEISRPDQDGELSIDIEGGSFDIYKHPELRDPSNELQGRPGFDRKHDVYSLGLILLEIGVWQPLQNFFNRKLSPFESARKVLSIACTNLPHQMGRSYCEAVVECIDCEQLRLSRIGAKSMGADTGADRFSNDERGGVSLELFIEKVIKRLEECHCRD